METSLERSMEHINSLFYQTSRVQAVSESSMYLPRVDPSGTRLKIKNGVLIESEDKWK